MKPTFVIVLGLRTIRAGHPDTTNIPSITVAAMGQQSCPKTPPLAPKRPPFRRFLGKAYASDRGNAVFRSKTSIGKALRSLPCAEGEMSRERLMKIANGVKASGLVFEYDVPPHMHKMLKRLLTQEKAERAKQSQQ
jgi:hypothetical protein